MPKKPKRFCGDCRWIDCDPKYGTSCENPDRPQDIIGISVDKNATKFSCFSKREESEQ